MQTLTQPALTTHSKTRPFIGVRDERLDFWRALCLIDMVLVHLIYDGVNFGVIQKTIGEYTRFAAGGFVFVAGLSIGAIFLPRTFADNGRRKVYLSLWRRAFYILCVHFAATLSFVSLDLIKGMRTEVPSILSLIRDILFFREGGDLLPLYVVVVAASPLLLELIRRRLWWIVAAGSLGLFFWGQNHPWLFSSPIHQNFPVILWQAIFTAGILFGAVLPKYTKLASSWKLALTIIAAIFSLLLWAGDFRSDFGWTMPVLPLAFIKTPLSLGEALRYFSIIFTIIFATDLLWARIAASKSVALISTMGRRSLVVYVAHVWIVGLSALFAWNHQYLGAWQMLLAIPAVALMWLVAAIFEWKDSRKISTARSWQNRWLPIPVGIAAAAAAFLVTGSLIQIQPPVTVTIQPPILSNSTDETRDFDESDDPQVPSFDPQDSADMMTA